MLDRFDIEKCQKCGGKIKVIACLEDADVIETILKHLGLDEASQVKIDHRQSGFSGIQDNFSDISLR